MKFALALQLADLATFAIAGIRLDVAAAEQNPLMVVAFLAFGLAGVATFKIALIGGMFLIRSRIRTRTRKWGTGLIALGGLIGTAANVSAMVALG